METSCTIRIVHHGNLYKSNMTQEIWEKIIESGIKRISLIRDI